MAVCAHHITVVLDSAPGDREVSVLEALDSSSSVKVHPQNFLSRSDFPSSSNLDFPFRACHIHVHLLFVASVASSAWCDLPPFPLLFKFDPSFKTLLKTHLFLKPSLTTPVHSYHFLLFSLDDVGVMVVMESCLSEKLDSACWHTCLCFQLIPEGRVGILYILKLRVPMALMKCGFKSWF